MTDKLREAAQQALEAMEQAHDESLDENHFECRQVLMGQITALRTALAEQPAEQEPVAWMWKDGTLTSDPDRADGTWTPLYTAPQPTKPAEQPAEPVAIVTALSVHADGVVRASLNCELPLMMELYAAPPTPEACKPTKQPLTDEEIDVLWAKQQTKPFKTHAEDRMAFARAIERAHGITEGAK